VSAYAVKKERASNPDFDNAVSFYYWRMKLVEGICSVADGRAAEAYLAKLGVDVDAPYDFYKIEWR
jgi:hypothetical protein